MAGPRQAAALEDPLEVAKRAIVAIGQREHAVHEVRPGSVQPILRDALAFVVEKEWSVVTQQVENLVVHWSQQQK